VRALPTARLLLVLVPIACVGLFGRVYYTPDEPREASLVVAMASQADKALPELDGRPFAEKPPLLYWLGGASVAALGATPAAARVPNLLYILITALAMASLAARAAGGVAAFTAGVVAVTALQVYQVLIWLATDAPLVAGTALALAGAHAGLTATARRPRLVGYLVFNAGLALAFFAKGFAGWLVPVLAFLSVIVLERRWRELFCPELWFGVPLVLAAIGAWVYAVDRLPAGREALKVMFWYNLVGRAITLDAPPEFSYASGHRNSAAKYLLELPLYLLPWVALAIAATRRGLRRWRAAGAEGTAWRLAFGAIVPATIALSFAATARGVYYAPVELGFVLLIGLYAGSAGAALDRTDRACWRATGWLVAALAVVLGGVAALLAFAPAFRDATGVALGVLALAGTAAAVVLALRPGPPGAGAVPSLAVATALVLTVVVGPIERSLNRWLSLEDFAGAIRAAAGQRPLIVLGADETTIAMTTLYVPAAERALVLAEAPGAAAAASAALAARGGAARIAWLVPDSPRWSAADWMGFLGYAAPRIEGPAPPLPAGLTGVSVRCVLTRPGGRTVAVLAPGGATDGTCAHAAGARETS